MTISFGRLIREYRERVGLTQKDLGGKVGLTGSMISRYESGDSTPSQHNLQLIINALALEGLPKEELDEMQELIGRAHSEAQGYEQAESILSLIQHHLEIASSERKPQLLDSLRNALAFEQGLGVADRHEEQRKWKQHIQELRSLRTKRERQHQNDFLRIDEKLAKSYFRNGQYIEAITYYESALWSSRHLEDRKKSAQILVELGNIHRRIGGANDWAAAHELYREARQIFERLNDRIGAVNCERRSAVIHLFQGRPDKALPVYEQCLDIYREANEAVGTYKTLQQMAWAYSMLGRWEEATELCREALEIVKDITSDSEEIAKAYRYLGDPYRLRRLNGPAEEAYKKTLEFRDKYVSKHGDTDATVEHIASVAKLRLSKVYLKQPGRQLEAKSLLNESLGAHLELKEEFYIAENLAEQGDLLLRVKRFDDAEMRLKGAEERFRRMGNAYYQTIVLYQLCRLYYEKGDFEEVKKRAAEAKSLDNGLIDYQLATVNLTLGKLHLNDKNHSEAESALCEATLRASRFNAETFEEVLGRVSDAINLEGSSHSPEVVSRLYEAVIKYWEGKVNEPSMTQSAQKAVALLKQKQAEAKTLTTI